ncbi:MAG: chromosome segregation protein SMC [Bacillota bacterium]|nr:chromosome segregation protein SMC [Bacillota bacterium]
MYFKKIEMQGFKSFADPVTVEFDRGITCVVGPNGSGKSNISDAIRWVLGEQSPKMLRGAKMDEVIFAGTAGRKSRGMAEVTLTIDNADRSLDIDYQEVAITRRMYRTGESEYFINRNQCRLRDIRELIMDTGIGVDGYSIIGQGKISDIISSKTESRREIFEEAAGIVAYRTKKAESERKLESTTANMDRVLDIIAEIDRKLPNLKEDSIKAEEYLKLRERYKELEINIVLKNIEKIQLNTEFVKDELMELDMDISNTEENSRTKEENLKEYNRKNETLEKLANETQQKLISVIDELNTLVNKGELDKERVAYIERTTATLKEEIKLAEEKLQRETANLTQLESSKKEADKSFVELTGKLNEEVAEYNEMSEELSALMIQVDEYRNKVFDKSSDISAAKAEISSLKMLRETLERRQQAILSQRETGDGSNRDIIDRLNKLKSERQELVEEIEDEKENQAEALKNIILRKADCSRLSSEGENLRIELGQMSSRTRTLRELDDNYDGYNYAVKYVMKSGLSGIHGVVADLISVPDGYETAIETALGGAIQNIVCDDDSSAKKAINALKTNKAGRLTFLPVSSVRGSFKRDGNAEMLKGFVGFGPECVKADSKYDDIIANLLGRVVIVDTMDNAVAMSKRIKGYRFVTLDGEVINASGAITGGKYKNKTANILDRKSEITALEQKMAGKRTEADKVSKELEKVEEELASLEEVSKDQDKKIRELTYDLIEKDNEIKTSESSLREIKSDSERLDKELKEIEEEKRNSLSMANALEEKIRESQREMSEAEQLGEKKLEEYNRLKDGVADINEKITAARIDVKSCEDRMTHIDDMLAIAGEAVAEARSDIESRELKITKLKEEKEGITFGKEDVGTLINDKEKEKTHLQDYSAELNSEKSECSAKIAAASAEREEAAKRMGELQDKKYQLNIKLAKNETQLENYKEKLWEDFEVSYAQAMDFRSEEFVMGTAVKENRSIKARIKELGEVNVGAIEEYREEKKRYDFLVEQRDDIQSAMDGICSIIEELDKKIKLQFKESFDRIVINFEEKFRELFGGGHAELRLSDESNPLESDIDIIAQPPGKKLQNINLLSGGEKTLTAIALMFGVLGAKPTPFCILDEVEAALDDANIGRFIDCLRSLHGIQFALVTHQKSTMEHADVLYGVTMPEKGVSKVLSLAMGDSFEI